MNVLVLQSGVSDMKGYVRTAEAARRFGVTTRTILRWVDLGYFPGTRKQNPRATNSPILIPVSALENFAQEQVITPDQDDGESD